MEKIQKYEKIVKSLDPEGLANLCNTFEIFINLCPMKDGKCPFGEKECEEIVAKDWEEYLCPKE